MLVRVLYPSNSPTFPLRLWVLAQKLLEISMKPPGGGARGCEEELARGRRILQVVQQFVRISYVPRDKG